MAIITTAEVKTLLQISGSTYDSLIAALIPPLQSWIIEYTNNPFHSSKYISGATIAFVDSNPDTITDSGSGFVDAGFTDGIDIHVEGSKDNDGFYYVDTVTAGTLTLDSDDELIAESAGYDVLITRVRFPKSLKIVVAKLIGYDLNKNKMWGISDQSLGDYRVKFDGGGVKGGGYPQGLLLDLEPFRKVKFPRVTNNEQVGGD